MKPWRVKLLLLAGVAAVAGSIPAISQEAPESLLPPGFDDPATLPAPAETPQQPKAAPQAVDTPSVAPSPGSIVTIENAAQDDMETLGLVARVQAELPASSRRRTDFVGPLGPSNWGLGENAFGGANGRFLSMLMRRLDAPLPSRWTSILLRRALLSQVRTPSQVSDVDWIAERAWLLLRMGEADGARMLVQSVDVENFTPRMFTVAVQTALATADPAALCPLVGPGRKNSDEPVWPLADAMCAALEGEPSRAGALIDQARRRSGAGGIDILLAEKVIGAGTDTRRAVTIQWDGVDTLNAWRFGLASATGLEIPDALMSGAGAHVRAWQARAPMVPLDQRISAAQTAASLGVFSNAALVDTFSLIADATDPSEIQDSIGGRLRRAFVGGDMDRRMSAIKGLWDDAKTPQDRHARLILTATAAALIPPSDDRQADAADLIASMLSAGLDRQAARWSPIIGSMGEDGDRAWALLAIASPRPAVDTSGGRVSAFIDRDESLRGQRGRMLFAALAGLGRLDSGTAQDLAGDLGISLQPDDRWSRMLAAAARARQPGTVALLAGVGMQTGDWRGVPPQHLFQIVDALRQVGLEYEARMIAAEALARL
ncbi:hypothetical protein [Sphingosinicella rhizophila]|uniref:Antifreeze glycopeptide polyprotein n=1 Tax=Sphingosinicella rhizophila TaxID=3050082 RepID=A0ABU3Q368_9SPHN|nr:hypothetical protein [Sphingosinicella sp. GR2756]MDT9597856.1 hypothetical protein [Sphingosinicella sp. GR2756]